jgi:hypothetical protein
LPAAFRAARCRVAAILPARAIAARIPRPVAAYIAIAVTIAAISVAIPVTAAAEAIMTGIALRRPFARGLRGWGRWRRGYAAVSAAATATVAE